MFLQDYGPSVHSPASQIHSPKPSWIPGWHFVGGFLG